MKKFIGQILTGTSICGLLFTSATVAAADNSGFEARLDKMEKKTKVENPLEGIEISGQMTSILQSSNLSLKSGMLNTPNYLDYQHKRATGTFTSDLFVEKELSNGDTFFFDIEYANGAGVDAPLQGGAMVNNDVMEDPEKHNQELSMRQSSQSARQAII